MYSQYTCVYCVRYSVHCVVTHGCQCLQGRESRGRVGERKRREVEREGVEEGRWRVGGGEGEEREMERNRREEGRERGGG